MFLNKKLIISMGSIIVLAVICFIGSLSVKAWSLDTGENFNEVYSRDNGLYQNSPFYDISNVSRSIYLGDSGSFNQVKVLPIYNMVPNGTVGFSEYTTIDNPKGLMNLTEDGRYTAQKAGIAEIGVGYRLSDDFKKELLSKYPDAWNTDTVRTAIYTSDDYMYAKYSNQTFYVTIKEHTVPLYRMYNPNSGEHFYTENSFERDSLVKAGWNYEGVAEESPIKTVYNQAVYRVYNPNAGDHFYTENKAEVAHLVSLGWRAEGIAFYSSTSNETPIYRLYNPNATVGTHFYTQSSAERDSLVRAGWHYEGTAWYGG